RRLMPRLPRIRVLRRGVLAYLAMMGPGFVTASAGNDAGGIATYAQAGGAYDDKLLWAMLLVTVALIVVQEMCARMGAVTGKGLSDLIREEFGIGWAALAMLGLLVANGAITISEFVGINAAMRVIAHEPRLHGTALGAGLVAFLIPLVGTTISPYMQFFVQSAVVEKGVRPRDYHYTRVEVVASSLFAILVALFIIIATAAALYGRPGAATISDAGTFALALEPVLGAWAGLLFAIGLFGASLLAATVLPLSTA